MFRNKITKVIQYKENRSCFHFVFWGLQGAVIYLQHPLLPQKLLARLKDIDYRSCFHFVFWGLQGHLSLF